MAWICRSVAVAVVLAACATGGDAPEAVDTSTPDDPVPTASTEDAAPTSLVVTTTTALPTTTLPTTSTLSAAALADLAAAEAVIDAFYTFDPEQLAPFLESASPGAIAFLTFYQGWAEGANYVIVDRRPCEKTAHWYVECNVTVEDDLMAALGVESPVVDSFRLFLNGGSVTTVELASDDPAVLEEAFSWTFEHRAELFEDGAACQQLFEGGPTPGACAEAVVAAFSEFTASGG
jgi:hypothetical protein